MGVSDSQRAAATLGRLNYYRLTAYWFPFYTDNSRTRFAPGTRFDDILKLYEFDRRLRLRVMDAVERVEVALRTQLAHQLAMRHGPWSFEDASLFSRAHVHRLSLQKLDVELKHSRETFIEHYQQRYGSPARPPIWVSCEVMSLGLLSKLFSNLKTRADRQAIAKAFALDERVMTSLMHNLTFLRNLCAHHSRLWNRAMVVEPLLPQRAAKNLQQSLEFPSTPRQQQALPRIYNSLVLLSWCLNQISDDQRWRQQIIDLLAEYPNVDQAAMGFPADWLDRPLWCGVVS